MKLRFLLASLLALAILGALTLTTVEVEEDALRPNASPLFSVKSAVQWERCGKEGSVCRTFHGSAVRMQFREDGMIKVVHINATYTGEVPCSASRLQRKSSSDLQLECFVRIGQNAGRLAFLMGGSMYDTSAADVALFSSAGAVQTFMMKTVLARIGERAGSSLNHLDVLRDEQSRDEYEVGVLAAPSRADPLSSILKLCSVLSQKSPRARWYVLLGKRASAFPSTLEAFLHAAADVLGPRMRYPVLTGAARTVRASGAYDTAVSTGRSVVLNRQAVAWLVNEAFTEECRRDAVGRAAADDAGSILSHCFSLIPGSVSMLLETSPSGPFVASAARVEAILKPFRISRSPRECTVLNAKASIAVVESLSSGMQASLQKKFSALRKNMRASSCGLNTVVPIASVNDGRRAVDLQRYLALRADRREKVFVLGMRGTGVSRITTALEALGYQCFEESCSGFFSSGIARTPGETRRSLAEWLLLPPAALLRQRGGVAAAGMLRTMKYATAIGDSGGGFTFSYAEADKTWPGSRFVLPLREGGAAAYATSEIEVWKRAGVLDEIGDELQSLLNGTQLAHHLAKRYAEHVANVRAHFRGRDGVLLELTEGDIDAWEKLSRFTSRRLPKRPHLPPLRSLSKPLPTVSLIIPTNGRPEFLAFAIERIKRQSYPPSLISDVVVVDDSEQGIALDDAAIGELSRKLLRPSGGGPELKYVRVDDVLSVGAKRNLAVEHADGEVIVHWDDDDFYGPHRVAVQVAPIASGVADLDVMTHYYSYYLAAGTAVKSTRGVAGNGPHFGTLTYLRRLWQAIPFTDNSLSEDFGFAYAQVVNNSARFQIIQNQPAGSFVCTRHGSNTWAWDASSPWAKKAAELMREVAPATVLSGEDLRAAAAMASYVTLIAERRKSVPSVNRFKAPGIDFTYFSRHEATAHFMHAFDMRELPDFAISHIMLNRR